MEMRQVNEKRTGIFIIIPFFFLLIPLLPVIRSGNAILIYSPQLLMGAVSIYILSLWRGRVPDYIFAFWALGFVFYVYGCLTYNGSFASALIAGRRLFFPAMFLTIGHGSRGKIQEKKIIYILTIMLFIQVALSLLPSVSLTIRQIIGTLYRDDIESFLYGFQYSTTKRAIGSIGNPNLLCLYVDVISSIIFYRADYIKIKKANLLKAFSLFATILICIETQSREGIIVFLILVFLYFYLRGKNKKTFILVIPLYMLFVYIIYSFLSSRIFRTIDLTGITTRTQIWNDIISSTTEGSLYNQLFGIGYQNARTVSFFDNIYLKYYVSGGIIGVILLLLCIVLLLLKCKNSIISLSIIAIWLVSSFACEFQETFKISSISFFAIAYFIPLKENLEDITSILRHKNRSRQGINMLNNRNIDEGY